MPILLSALCAVSANLDTLAIGMAFGMKKVKISFGSAVTIALISTFGTWLSMKLGVMLTNRFDNAFLSRIGAWILIAMGIWFTVKSVLELTGLRVTPKTLSQPEKADTDHSGRIELKESVMLALALTVNNLGVGAAAGAAGVGLWLTTTFTFAATFLALKLGADFGKSALTQWLGEYASLVSGCVIFMVGLASLF